MITSTKKIVTFDTYDRKTSAEYVAVGERKVCERSQVLATVDIERCSDKEDHSEYIKQEELN